MPVREDAYRLMTEHVKNENLRKHMLSVEAAMRVYARKYGEDEELWGMIRDGGYDERIIYAILAHNDLNTCYPRNNLLSHALYACDEVTGMITATALVRQKTLPGLPVASVRKKMKTKGFAAGVNREDLVKGAGELGVDLDEHIANVIEAMSSIADQLGLAGVQEAVAD